MSVFHITEDMHNYFDSAQGHLEAALAQDRY